MEAKARLVRLLKRFVFLLALGLGYALAVRALGRGLSCPFYRATGLWCPGCGASRVCLALLRGDLGGAWQANPALVLLAPVLAGLLGLRAARYVRSGRAETPAWEAKIWAVIAFLLVAYGILRNLPGMELLAPR